MNKMKDAMKTLESNEQTIQMIAEIQELSKELDKLKQQGR